MENKFKSKKPKEKKKLSDFEEDKPIRIEENDYSSKIKSKSKSKSKNTRLKIKGLKIKEIKEILKKLIRNHLITSYDSDKKIFDGNMVETLIFNKNCNFVSLFKDYMIMDYCDEFLKRYYRVLEANERLPKISNYYKNYLKFFCNPIFRDFRVNEIVQNFGDNKAELYYKNNYGDPNNEKVSKKRNDKVMRNEDKLFSSTVKKSIDENVLTESNMKDENTVILDDLTTYSINFPIVQKNENHDSFLFDLLENLKSQIDSNKEKVRPLLLSRNKPKIINRLNSNVGLTIEENKADKSLKKTNEVSNFNKKTGSFLKQPLKFGFTSSNSNLEEILSNEKNTILSLKNTISNSKKDSLTDKITISRGNSKGALTKNVEFGVNQQRNLVSPNIFEEKDISLSNTRLNEFNNSKPKKSNENSKNMYSIEQIKHNINKNLHIYSNSIQKESSNDKQKSTALENFSKMKPVLETNRIIYRSLNKTPELNYIIEENKKSNQVNPLSRGNSSTGQRPDQSHEKSNKITFSVGIDKQKAFHRPSSSSSNILQNQFLNNNYSNNQNFKPFESLKKSEFKIEDGGINNINININNHISINNFKHTFSTNKSSSDLNSLKKNLEEKPLISGAQSRNLNKLVKVSTQSYMKPSDLKQGEKLFSTYNLKNFVGQITKKVSRNELPQNLNSKKSQGDLFSSMKDLNKLQYNHKSNRVQAVVSPKTIKNDNIVVSKGKTTRFDFDKGFNDKSKKVLLNVYEINSKHSKHS